MANISKPTDINKIWSASGDILAPSDNKISQGWAVEIPPRQYFNYIDNKQDQAIAHINQHGIATWDNQTEYQANLSYTQGSNGVVYKCLVTNTNINPVGDITNSWRVAFIDGGSSIGPVVATAAQSRAQTDNTVFISPLQLLNAFTGAKQSLSQNGFQVLPGGLIINWGQGDAASGTTATVNYGQAFANNTFIAMAIDAGVSNRTISNTSRTKTSATFQFSGSANSFYWIALGN
jgi:hypothetical protein